MIYFSGLDSVIESVYLSDSLDNKIGSCNVFINPSNIKYLTGKTVILNKSDYPDTMVDVLVSNGCHIISRTYNQHPDIEVQPYILRINFNILWNGMVLYDFAGDLDSLLDKDKCKYDTESGILYFPKIYNFEDTEVEDNYGNLTALGWALQEVGINIKKYNTIFNNLDIIKSGKVVF